MLLNLPYMCDKTSSATHVGCVVVFYNRMSAEEYRNKFYSTAMCMYHCVRAIVCITEALTFHCRDFCRALRCYNCRK